MWPKTEGGLSSQGSFKTGLTVLPFWLSLKNWWINVDEILCKLVTLMGAIYM